MELERSLTLGIKHAFYRNPPGYGPQMRDLNGSGLPKMAEKSPEQIALPPPGAKAWGSRRKASVILGIRRGLITRERAYEMYLLSQEELASWETAFDQGGHRALTNKARPRGASPAKPHRG